MKEIPLSRGYVTIVDDEDYEALVQYKWYALFGNASDKPRAHNRKLGLMHRVILGAPRHLDVDHRDLDPLNNRRDNLRTATKTQNAQNRPAHRNNKSGLKGAFMHHGKWKSEIVSAGVRHKLGVFTTAEAAHAAYAEAAVRLHADFSRKS